MRMKCFTDSDILSIVYMMRISLRGFIRRDGRYKNGITDALSRVRIATEGELPQGENGHPFGRILRLAIQG